MDKNIASLTSESNLNMLALGFTLNFRKHFQRLIIKIIAFKFLQKF